MKQIPAYNGLVPWLLSPCLYLYGVGDAIYITFKPNQEYLDSALLPHSRHDDITLGAILAN